MSKRLPNSSQSAAHTGSIAVSLHPLSRVERPCILGERRHMTAQFALVGPASRLPNLLRRPLARPLRRDIRIARRPPLRRLDFDQILNLESAAPEHSEPITVGQVELDASIARPLDPIHSERR